MENEEEDEEVKKKKKSQATGGGGGRGGLCRPNAGSRSEGGGPQAAVHIAQPAQSASVCGRVVLSVTTAAAILKTLSFKSLHHQLDKFNILLLQSVFYFYFIFV